MLVRYRKAVKIEVDLTLVSGAERPQHFDTGQIDTKGHGCPRWFRLMCLQGANDRFVSNPARRLLRTEGASYRYSREGGRMAAGQCAASEQEVTRSLMTF